MSDNDIVARLRQGTGWDDDDVVMRVAADQIERLRCTQLMCSYSSPGSRRTFFPRWFNNEPEEDDPGVGFVHGGYDETGPKLRAVKDWRNGRTLSGDMM